MLGQIFDLRQVQNLQKSANAIINWDSLDIYGYDMLKPQEKAPWGTQNFWKDHIVYGLKMWKMEASCVPVIVCQMAIYSQKDNVLRAIDWNLLWQGSARNTG